MSSWGQESCYRRRTSERRRLKLLRNLNQYKIANPYRYVRKDHSIPEEISKQLKKVDYLSLTSINMLKLPFMYVDSAHNEIVLAKMAGALEDQSKKFVTMFGQSLLDYKQVDVEESSQSDHHQANPSQGSEAVQTKEEMPVSINIYDYGRDHIEQSIFEIGFRNMGGQEMKGIEQDLSERYKEGEEMLGEDYQKYFMN